MLLTPRLCPRRLEGTDPTAIIGYFPSVSIHKRARQVLSRTRVPLSDANASSVITHRPARDTPSAAHTRSKLRAVYFTDAPRVGNLALTKPPHPPTRNAHDAVSAANAAAMKLPQHPNDLLHSCLDTIADVRPRGLIRGIRRKDHLHRCLCRYVPVTVHHDSGMASMTSSPLTVGTNYVLVKVF